MNLYLEGEEPTEAQLKKGIRKATIAMNMFPVLCGSSFKNKGVQTLLDAVVDYLPSPLDIPPMIGHDPDNMEKEIIRKPEDSEPLSALGFKIMTDPFVGSTDLYPGVLGHAEDGGFGAESAHRQDRTHRPFAENARQ